MLATRLTALLQCQVPIQQAPMGGVASGPELAIAVAEAGAVGMVASGGLPFEILAPIVDEVCARTTGVFGVNFLIPFLDRQGVEFAASKAALVDFFYADPDPSLVRLVHEGGALAGWQVGSADEARAAEQAGCDVVVAQGVEAGGHVRGALGLLPLLDGVLDAVQIPVIAAGGIGTAGSTAAALAAGADGVRVGTRFIATHESAAHPDYIRALLAARPEDTVLTETFSVMWPDAPHRVLRSCVEAAEAFDGEVVGEAHMGAATMPIPRLAVPTPTQNTTGTIQAMALYAGQSVGAVRKVEPAASIVHELAHGAEHLLQTQK